MKREVINKEEIKKLHVDGHDVLDGEQQKQRAEKLHTAMLLGNGCREKCRIIFRADEGVKEVVTTVWFASDKYICLKGGITLLVSSILEVII